MWLLGDIVSFVQSNSFIYPLPHPMHNESFRKIELRKRKKKGMERQENSIATRPIPVDFLFFFFSMIASLVFEGQGR